MSEIINQNISQIIERISEIIENASEQLVERRVLFELVVLGIITKEHVLFIGPPGTGKSAAVKSAARQFSGTYFEYLIGRFTEPGELFGALDLAALKDGQVRPVVQNMLPEANIAFLDEIFLGSTAILNSLLGVLNERVYKRGTFECKVPLWSCVAASNALPEDPMLQAFADRFLLTSFVEPVSEENLNALLSAGWARATNESVTTSATAPTKLSAQDLQHLTDAVCQVDLTDTLESYAHIVRKLRVRGVAMSDRRLVKGQKLIAAAALLGGRSKASVADLWPVIYMIQDPDLQNEVKDLLAAELGKGENILLSESVKQSSSGPQARAVDLTKYGQDLLSQKPALTSDPGFEIWQVKLESLLTRIDAGFSAEDMPQTLSVLRTGLIASVSSDDTPAPKATGTD
ncbi:AAA family ATPase [Halocynthiibacter styelae]|uniref:AAA family ATPase n=1 Tax=Halocynthiibacter styelae TaxID=2761955 RepID=A0A8J7IWV6_9RHOB|nr:AAA family ATPase [Paenihalocynthiibacter styelae]MBI1494373.1 AAA family ATPase [Paenihalocynthiibacter styelae]